MDNNVIQFPTRDDHHDDQPEYSPGPLVFRIELPSEDDLRRQNNARWAKFLTDAAIGFGMGIIVLAALGAFS